MRTGTILETENTPSRSAYRNEFTISTYLPSRTITTQTAVYGAGAADTFNMLPQASSCAKEADVEGVNPLSRSVGEASDRFAVEVNSAEQFCISLGQPRQQFHHTLTECFFILRLQRSRQFMLKPFQGVLASGATAVGLDDGVPENAIEPSNNTFRVPWPSVCFQSLQKAFLYEVGGQLRITGAHADETREGIKMHKKRICRQEMAGRFQHTYPYTANQCVTIILFVRGRRMTSRSGSASNENRINP